MQPVYYAQLDTTRYSDLTVDAPLIRSRVITATAALALDLMVTRRVIMLSQSQVFDGAFLLSQVQPDGGAIEAKVAGSLRELIKANWIQTRIYPSGLIKRGSEEETFTVANAFVSRLDKGFRFSAWPELATSPSLRSALRDAVETRRTAGLDPSMAQRVDGLLMLDDAFRSSTSIEQAHVVAGVPLGVRISGHMKGKQVHDILRTFYGQVLTFRRAVIDGDMADASDELRDTMRRKDYLDSRSNWYYLLELFSDEKHLAKRNSYLEGLRAVIDFHYNAIVAESLGAGSSTDETEDLTVPQALRGSELEPEYQGIATMLIDPNTPGNPVTWLTAETQLNDLPNTWDNARRLRELLDQRVVQLTEDNRLVIYVKSLPVRAARATRAVLGGVAGGSTGSYFGGSGMIAGAVAGAFAETFLPSPPKSVGDLPPVRALEKWSERFVIAVENNRGESIRASLMSRAASYTRYTAENVNR